MRILCIILGIIAFVLALFVWKKDVLSKFKVEEQALLNMTRKDKNEASKSLASPIALLGILLISISLNIDKWRSSFIFLLIGVMILFVYIEKKTIYEINSLFKDKKRKVKVSKKNN